MLEVLEEIKKTLVSDIEDLRKKAESDNDADLQEKMSLIDMRYTLNAEQYNYVFTHNGERSEDTVKNTDELIALICRYINNETDEEYEMMYEKVRDDLLIFRKECIRQIDSDRKDPKEDVTFAAIIEPCPKCHSDELVYMEKDGKNRVVCKKCRFTYKEAYDSKDDALRSWNLVCRILKSCGITIGTGENNIHIPVSGIKKNYFAAN